MILGPHMLVGSAVALRTGNPVLGISAAILSHYILDATPHAEYTIGSLDFLRSKNPFKAIPTLFKIFCDIGFASLLIFLSARYAHQSIIFALAGGFAGILPDFTTFLLFLFPDNHILSQHSAFHHYIHFPKDKYASPILRFGLQAAVVIVSVAAIATL